MPSRVRPTAVDPHRVGRALVAVAAVAVLSVAGCGGGDGDDGLGEPEIQRPPSGDPSPVTTTEVPDAAQDSAVSSTTTTEPQRDVGDFDLATASVRLLCPGREATIALTGQPSDSLVVEVVDDLSYDLDQDGTSERVVLASCRPAAPDGEAGEDQRSIVALAASADGLVQLGEPWPASAVHDVDASLVAERVTAVDGRRETTYTPLTIIEGRLAEGGIGLPFTTDDPALPMGLGGLEVGAPYALLANNVGRAVTVLDTGSGDDCVVVRVEGALDGIRGLGGTGTLASVEVTNPEVRTDTGLGIGSSEDEVRAAHGDHLERARDPDAPDREFLVASPPDTGGLTAVFEMARGSVVGFRVGEPGWASALDGCS